MTPCRYFRIQSGSRCDSVTGRVVEVAELIYLLTAVGLTPGGSSTVQCTFTHKQYIEQHSKNNTINNKENAINKKNTTNKRTIQLTARTTQKEQQINNKNNTINNKNTMKYNDTINKKNDTINKIQHN